MSKRIEIPLPCPEHGVVEHGTKITLIKGRGPTPEAAEADCMQGAAAFEREMKERMTAEAAAEAAAEAGAHVGWSARYASGWERTFGGKS